MFGCHCEPEDFFVPQAAKMNQVLRVHLKKYVDRLCNLELSKNEFRTIQNTICAHNPAVHIEYQAVSKTVASWGPPPAFAGFLALEVRI